MTSEEGRVLARLQEWADREGGLPGFAVLYRDLLSMQMKAKARIAAPSIPPPEFLLERQEQGIPCLRFDDIAWDWALFQELFREVVRGLAEHQVGTPDEMAALAQCADSPTFLTRVCRTLYEAGVVPKDEAGIADHTLLQTATQAAMWPFLSRYAEALLSSIRQEEWRRGVCPICGGRPDFGFLEKEVGARWLMCGRCDAHWLYRRIGCPCCGTDDASKLSYLVSEDEVYRLYLCEQCRGYLKVIDLRKAGPDVLLPLERILTLDMDRQARELGYGAGARACP